MTVKELISKLLLTTSNTLPVYVQERDKDDKIVYGSLNVKDVTCYKNCVVIGVGK